MKKEDIIRKLCSRKFAVALIGFITALLVAFKLDENQIAQVTAIVGSFLTLIAYIFAEGQTDVASLNSSITQTTITKAESKTNVTNLNKDLNKEAELKKKEDQV